MPLQMDAAQVMLVLQSLYTEARRASNVAREVMAQHSVTHEEFNQIIDFLKQNDMITNIEKNKSNGEAVYKLTRKGERLLEQKIPSLYHGPESAAGKGESAC